MEGKGEREGEVFGAGRGEIGTHCGGESWMCRVCPWDGGREGTGADAGMKKRLLMSSSWQRNKSRFGPGG